MFPEKAPFDYDRQTHSSDLLNVFTSAEDLFDFKIKSELSSIDNVNIGDNIIKEDNIAFVENKDILNMMPSSINNDKGDVNNYIVINNNSRINTNSSNVFTQSTTSKYEDLYHTSSDKVTPVYSKLITEEDEFLPTVNNCSDIYFVRNETDDYCIENTIENSNSPENYTSTNHYILLQTASIETPDNSRSPSNFTDMMKATSPPLSLKIDGQYKNSEMIDTPDVIETIDAIENEKGFNILNFITGDVSYINCFSIVIEILIYLFFNRTSKQLEMCSKYHSYPPQKL